MHGKYLVFVTVAAALVVLAAVAAGQNVDNQAGGATPNPEATRETTEPPDGMVAIPGGSFLMGCMGDAYYCYDSEWPAHPVTLDAFFLDVHETTVAEYAACVSAGKCQPARTKNDRWAVLYNRNRADRQNHPANGVTWKDANAYCRWQQKRLPTEAEFEYALRGGHQDFAFPWGNEDWPPLGFANYTDESAHRLFPVPFRQFGYDDGYPGTSPVCSFPLNPFGLCDISGNVDEWVADWYDEEYYHSSPVDNPQGPGPQPYRVYRGGSYRSWPTDARLSWREGNSPDYFELDLGFRCARD